MELRRRRDVISPCSSKWISRASLPHTARPNSISPAPSRRHPPADKPDGEKTRMNVSPLDLRQQRFRSAFRGFDKVEVTSLLAAAADDYEQALRETDQLRQDLARVEALVTEHREREKNLQR